MGKSIEETVATFAQNRLDINNLDSISLDTIIDLEEMIRDEQIEGSVLDRVSNNFQGLIIVKVFPDGDIKTTCKNEVCFTNEDENKIREWLLHNEHETYSEDLYRLDLNYVILLFKIYKFNDNKFLIGHMLQNNSLVKVELLEARQRYLMRNFL